MAKTASDACPCGNPASYTACCGRYLDERQEAPSAEALMRSRYTAYALKREPYLLDTWHPATRPQALNLNDDASTKWIGLDVKHHALLDQTHATVTFVARCRILGRAQRLHETSRFVHEDGRWFYVDGDIET